MDVSQFLGGNFLTHTDLPQPVQQWTIGKVDQQMVGQGQNAEKKICITFNEFPTKPLALNKTNLKRVAGLYTVNAAGWSGGRLLVYRTWTSYAGQPLLCVRVNDPDRQPPVNDKGQVEMVCDLQGNPVSSAVIQQPATPMAPQAQPTQLPQAPAPQAQPPVAPQQPAAPAQQQPVAPVQAPQPPAQSQPQQQPVQPQPPADQAAPWEGQPQQPQQTNPPGA